MTLSGLGFPLVVASLLLGGAAGAQQATASDFDHQHAAWTALLADTVHPGGLVDYPALALRRAELDAYLSGLQAVTVEHYRDWTATEREAYWINAYNAYTVQLVLDHWPVASIKDLGGFFSSVFSKRYIPLQHLARSEAEAEVHGRKALSLGELEHGVLGRIARRPLFHFAIVCASRSCPELRASAYTAAELDEQLAAQARQFLADPTKNDTRIVDRRLRVSRIFDWSEDELQTYPGGIRGLLKTFGPATLGDDPELADVRLRYRDYDWSLNLWNNETNSGE